MTSKTRRRNAARAGAGFAGFLITCAAAFFLASILADGEHEGTTGSPGTEELAIAVDFADGVAPENNVPVTADLENTTGGPVSGVGQFSYEILTPEVPQCGQEWLRLSAKDQFGQNDYWSEAFATGELDPSVVYPAGTSDLWQGEPEGREIEVFLTFSPWASIDQTACADTAVTLKIHVES